MECTYILYRFYAVSFDISCQSNIVKTLIIKPIDKILARLKNAFVIQVNEPLARLRLDYYIHGRNE